jgi:hypothetical protein
MTREDLIMPRKYGIEIKEIRDCDLGDCIRVFCSSYPDGFEFQIRTHQPIKWKGKKRYMFANVYLTIEEMEKILAYMKEASKD